ncbi:MAG: Type 1 glutamine amidotransferase-like domain-containing protein [Nanoarchaeota archaeon]|nr:Type 1 glutamine amidotransferase-like domain-containing protein [Nanoarchaeota archaeon]MBU4351723.1 Type 1 glutamine amidotransferase-like domain-containing protein [Nanoarchaeota archaeon]
MKIILSGGGSGKDSQELDKLFASLLNKSKPLLYIPIAIDNIKHPYPDCLKWLKSTFNKLNITKYELWAEEDLKKSQKINPLKFSGIYIGGGNTPYLLNKLKKTGFWNFLKKAIKLNLPIYGGSAGAIIFSKSIILSLYEDKNWIEIKNLTGMNSLNNYELTTHYNLKDKNKMMKLSEKHNSSPIIALSEKNGLYINNNKIFLIGQEPAKIFHKGKIREIKLNQELIFN